MCAWPRGTDLRSRFLWRPGPRRGARSAMPVQSSSCRSRQPYAITIRRPARDVYLLLGCLLASGHRLADAAPRARVRARALAANRQVAAMPNAAIAVDLDQPLDIHIDFAAKIALNLVVAVDELAQSRNFILG